MIRKALLASIAVVVLLAAGGVWLNAQSPSSGQLGNQLAPKGVSPPTSAHRPSTSVLPARISDWKTYTNDEHGFEFEYPPIWTMSDQSSDWIDLNIYNNPDQPGGGALVSGAELTFAIESGLSSAVITHNAVQAGDEPFADSGFTGFRLTTPRPEANWGDWIEAYRVLPDGHILQLHFLSSNQSDKSNFSYESYLLPVLATLTLTTE